MKDRSTAFDFVDLILNKYRSRYASEAQFFVNRIKQI